MYWGFTSNARIHSSSTAKNVRKLTAEKIVKNRRFIEDFSEGGPPYPAFQTGSFGGWTRVNKIGRLPLAKASHRNTKITLESSHPDTYSIDHDPTLSAALLNTRTSSGP